ncbi:flagellar biosynthesis protein FlaG [Pueribacillus theae]|uniref:Flagellar biosynthesis protein FlaG n=2 Tax=Pueribacillus theae TaxID=2171751 RepID=A0A2U1K5Y2_9BACI|nr:flagellar biosynthesis protein FlaG [Pueribacillus theae]
MSNPSVAAHTVHRITDSGIRRHEQPGQEEKNTFDEQLMTERVRERVDAVNDFLLPIDISVKFTFHEELQEYYVEVVDKNTQEVIREIPPKKFLDMYAGMAKFMGLFVDEKR